ncbi:hypothetical protein [Streptomyces sp. 1222.5]|uniref:hypothetical protein n=1 Tax=Streptomyces sp. 1222.5 TaxID=1881026 RepID=UPI003EC062F0
MRDQPDEAQRLVHLGEMLRRAHQDLDGEQLRELSAQQHQVTRALARQAGQLTARAGQPISDDTRQEVQATLHAVLADPDAARQWVKGRLTKPLSAPAGFPTLSRQPAPPATVRRTEPAGEVADRDAASARYGRQQEERLEQARRQAADAEQHLHDREADLAAAEEKLSRAQEEQQQAEQRVDDLARQLKDAESAKQRAREAARQARDHTRTADRAAREARRRAHDTAAHADHLAEQMPHTS